MLFVILTSIGVGQGSKFFSVRDGAASHEPFLPYFSAMATILCVDDDVQVSSFLGDTLERAGHTVVFASNVVEALQALAKTQVELIVTDYRMPGLSGLEFISLLRDEGYEIPMILITGHGSIEQAVAAIKTGAVDYITKPVMPQQLIHAVGHALEVEHLRRENDALRSAMMEVR